MWRAGVVGGMAPGRDAGGETASGRDAGIKKASGRETASGRDVGGERESGRDAGGETCVSSTVLTRNEEEGVGERDVVGAGIPVGEASRGTRTDRGVV